MQLGTAVDWGNRLNGTRILDDGLGTRRIETDTRDGSQVEVLELAPGLTANEGFEAAIRARAARFADVAIEGLASVRRIERQGSAMCVVADHVDGLRLPDFLYESVKGNVPLTQPAALDLAGQIIRVVAALHELPGLSHGGITPAHVVITRAGKVVITDAVFGPALEELERNREQLWREFRLAMPASANLPRFDQRGDVTQLAATVLAVALGRVLRGDEYPRVISEIVIAATLAARPGETGTSASALRMWLQQGLFLHPRATFGSAVDCEKAFSEVLGPAAARRGGTVSLQNAVRRIFGDTPASAEAVKMAAAWSAPNVIHPAGAPLVPPDPLSVPELVPESAKPVQPFSSVLRSVFPNFRSH